MLGIAAYESDDDVPPVGSAPTGGNTSGDGAQATNMPAMSTGCVQKPEASPLGAKPFTPEATPALPAADISPALPHDGAQIKNEKRIPAVRLQELRRQINKAKSATAVVQVVRNSFDSLWDARWGSEALYQIAMRSTARTRKEWATDASVVKLAERLRGEVTFIISACARGEEDVYTLLVALEGLRRMAFQEPQSQKEALERAIVWFVADNWRHPVKSLARLYWLGAPLKLKGKPADFSSLLPNELRNRASELDGPDVALMIAAMQHQGARDAALLEKVVNRLKTEGVHAGMAATDLVEMAEGLHVLGVQDEAALRPLGQETLRRRGELTPDESHRVHTAFQTFKLPLPQIWTKPGAAKKREGAQITTTQAFVPQEGHEKKRRGNHDIERTSPPRVVRDYKMMSF